MSLRREVARKLLHVSTAVVPVAYAAGLDRALVAGGLAVLLVVALAVEVARRSARGAAHFTRMTGTLLREHEHAGAWAGATWLLLAFLLAVTALPRDVAVAAMLGVSLGDAAGAVVGRWWGSRRALRRVVADVRVPGGPPHGQHVSSDASVHHPTRADIVVTPPQPADAPPVVVVRGIVGASKTWLGTVACALATALGALLVARLGPGEALLAGALAAAAERPMWRFDDNLRIVLAVGTGILLWRFAFS